MCLLNTHNFNIKVAQTMEDSVISFESGNSKSRRTLPNSRLTSNLEAQIDSLEQKQVTIWNAIDRLKETGSAARKETRRVIEELKADMKDKMQERVEFIEEILKTLDSKIDFVVDTCDQYIQGIGQKLSDFNRYKGQQEKQRGIINKTYEILSAKLQSLEEKTIKYSQTEYQLKSQIETLKQQNIDLTQQCHKIAGRANETIEKIRQQAIQKDEQIIKRDQIITNISEVRGKESQQYRQLCQTVQQQNFIIKQLQAALNTQQTIPQQQAHTVVQISPVLQVKEVLQPSIPSLNLLELSNLTDFQVIKEPHKSASPIGMLKESIVSSFAPESRVACNGFEIRPEFFKFGDSQLRKQSESPLPKGINVRSINRQDSAGTGIIVKKLKQSVDSGGFQKIRSIKKDQNHRFGYLLSNLVSTQTQTNIFEDYKESATSEQSHGTLMFHPK